MLKTGFRSERKRILSPSLSQGEGEYSDNKRRVWWRKREVMTRDEWRMNRDGGDEWQRNNRRKMRVLFSWKAGLQKIREGYNNIKWVRRKKYIVKLSLIKWINSFAVLKSRTDYTEYTDSLSFDNWQLIIDKCDVHRLATSLLDLHGLWCEYNYNSVFCYMELTLIYSRFGFRKVTFCILFLLFFISLHFKSDFIRWKNASYYSFYSV